MLLGTCTKHLKLTCEKKSRPFCMPLYMIHQSDSCTYKLNKRAFSNRICYCSIQFHQFRLIGQQQQTTVTVLYFRMLLFTERPITAIYRTSSDTAASYTIRFEKTIYLFIYLSIYLFSYLFIYISERKREHCAFILWICFFFILVQLNIFVKNNTNFNMWNKTDMFYFLKDNYIEFKMWYIINVLIKYGICFFLPLIFLCLSQYFICYDCCF